jgi:molybdenum cofactor cytidylyltransferase
VRLDEIAVTDAGGAVLAHTHRLPSGATFKKGRVLSAEDVRAFTEAGVSAVIAARLDPDDLGEDDAARALAEASTGEHVTIGAAATGRANLFADAHGLLVIDRARIDAVNLVDEALTIATLAPFAVVSPGEMVATVKVIPFAVPKSAVDEASARAREATPLVRVAPFKKKRVALVLTTLPGVRAVVLDRAAKNQSIRVAALGCEVVHEARAPHDRAQVASAIATASEASDLVVVLSASAIVDRRDVVPAAIEAAGGAIDHFGMPVDPGNLLLLARRGSVPIVGAPGCARSLKPSGFDWVLQRLVADLVVTRADIMRLGAGGLLAEMPSRPYSRLGPENKPIARVAAVVLAAGLSRRMGEQNKLLALVDGTPIVARVVDALLASKADPVLVVVGHQASEVKAALAGRPVRFVDNPDYEEGLGASLRAGVSALEEDVDAMLLALGDMPWIRAEHADALIDAFDPSGDKSICVPVHEGKRGHPVLWSSRHFSELARLGGDVGARAIIERNAAAIQVVAVSDPAVHLDVDTPEMLARASSLTRDRSGL